MKDTWIKVEHTWKHYPIGTKARESWNSGFWTKTERGWKWCCGDTFGVPGTSDKVMLPED